MAVSATAPAGLDDDGADAPTPPAGRNGQRPSLRTVLLVVAGVALVVGLLTDKGALQAAIFGAGSGALIAALAIGVVVTYRGSGVVNIATGALAMHASFVFRSLTSDGDLLVGMWRFGVGDPWGFVPALVITVLFTGALAGVLYLLVFSPLQTASPVAKLVASVGVLLVLQSAMAIEFGPQPLLVSTGLVDGSASLPGDVKVPYNQLLLTGILAVTALALWVANRYTVIGLATRAAAEDERRLTLLGRSPRVISGGNWVFSGMVVGGFACLVAPIAGSVDPVTITLLIVPALAAAVVGGFTSFSLAALAGLLIGMAQAVVTYLSTKGWFPTADGQALPGVVETVPLVVVALALLLRRARIGGRGALGTVRLPFAPEPRRPAAGVAVFLVIGVLAFVVLGPTWRLAGINTLVGITICLSLVILVGFVGQVSLAQMALAGFAGFTMARLSEDLGIGFPFAPLVGALGATVVGVLFALPALRVRGVQLAIVTLAAGLAVQSLIFRNPLWTERGADGATVPSPTLAGWDFGPTASSFGNGSLPNPAFGVFVVLVVAGLLYLTLRMRTAPWGRRMLAVRANERAAAAVGIPVARTKVVAFAISAFVAGLGGALSGYRFGNVTPETFGVVASLTFLAFAYLGGISSVLGAVLGGLLVTNGIAFTALDDIFGISSEYAALIGGIGLVLTVVTSPEGIAGALRSLRIRLTRTSEVTP